MKRLFPVFSIIYAFLISSCGESLDFINGLEKEEYVDSAVGFHNQGRNCLNCHGYNYKSQDLEDFDDIYGENEDDAIKFNIGGTIFKDINAQNDDWQNGADYHYVVLKTDTKSYKTNIGRGSGNFWLNANITEDFIVEVYNKEGKLVNYTLYRHKPSYKSCNSCHTVYGKNGAPGRIINY